MKTIPLFIFNLFLTFTTFCQTLTDLKIEINNLKNNIKQLEKDLEKEKKESEVFKNTFIESKANSKINESSKDVKPKKERVQLGLATSFFYDVTPNYFYLLNGNSSATEKKENAAGGMFSTVLLYRILKDKPHHIILNVPISTFTSTINLGNSQKYTPFGLGYSIELDNFQIAIMANYVQKSRLSEESRGKELFPIRNYPGLIIDGRIPQDIINRFANTSFKIFPSISFVAPLDIFKNIKI